MSRPNQMLLLEPNDVLSFRGPGEDCTASLELTNPTPYPICFKVKTTASRKYYVRPKTGLLLPYSRREVSFRLREEVCGRKEGSADSADRFKILSAVKPQDAKGTDPALLWGFVLESACMQSKLGVSIENVIAEPKAVRSAWNRVFRLFFFMVFFLTLLAGLGLTFIKIKN